MTVSSIVSAGASRWSTITLRTCPPCKELIGQPWSCQKPPQIMKLSTNIQRLGKLLMVKLQGFNQHTWTFIRQILAIGIIFTSLHVGKILLS